MIYVFRDLSVSAKTMMTLSPTAKPSFHVNYYTTQQI